MPLGIPYVVPVIPNPLGKTVETIYCHLKWITQKKREDKEDGDVRGEFHRNTQYYYYYYYYYYYIIIIE